jgi:hypothetical protein
MKQLILLISIFLNYSLEASVPIEAFTFDVNLYVTSYDQYKINKLEEASYLLKQVIQSHEFKQAVLKHNYLGKRRFHYDSGMSNRKIYKRILEGAESLNKDKNNTLDAEIDFFLKQDSKVIGYTKRNTHKIWINKKYFKKFNAAQLAGHLMHEWLHKLGFDHESDKTPLRKYSVPYAIGKIVKKLSTKWLLSNDLYGFYFAESFW